MLFSLKGGVFACVRDSLMDAVKHSPSMANEKIERELRSVTSIGLKKRLQFVSVCVIMGQRVKIAYQI